MSLRDCEALPLGSASQVMVVPIQLNNSSA